MANTVFKLRRSSVAGKVPNTSTLAIGELGINLTDKILYSSDGTAVFEIGSNNTIIRVTNTAFIANATVNSIAFTNAGITATSGVLTWNPDESTLDLGLAGNSSILQIGQETLYRVKNQTGSTITNGTLVMANGTVGASGRIKVTPAIANGSVPSHYIMGIATENIADGADGYVAHFGKVRGINTSAWPDGSILYADPANTGGLTATKPTAPNHKTIVAIVIHSATNGTLFVRPTFGSDLADDERVELTGLANGDMLVYRSANGRFENTKDLTIRSITANGTLGVNGQVLASNGSSTYWFTPIGGVVPIQQQYTANGSATIFSVTGGYIANAISVFLNGVLLRNGTEVDVTSGSTFTITPAPANGALIDVVGPSRLYSTGVNSIVSQQFTANGTANSFAITGGYISNSVLVFLNGVKQIPGTDVDITSGANVGFYSTPANGFIVDVYGYQTAVSLGANVISVGSNVNITTTSINIGNSTVNTQITAGNIALNGSLLTIGNSTVNTSLDGGTLTLGSNTATFGNAVYFVSNGNVGIGNNIPSNLLSIYSANNINSSVFINGDNNSGIIIQRNITNDNGPAIILRKARGSAASLLAVTSGDILGNINFAGWGGSTYRNFLASIKANVETYTDDTNISTYMSFLTNSSGGVTATERMRIDSDGKVGINCLPFTMLDVYKATNDTIARVKTGGAGAYYYAESYTSGYYGLVLIHNATEKWFVGGFGTNNLTFKEGRTGTEWMTILPTTGNVGVGNNAPADKLVVTGNITPGADNVHNLGSMTLRWANIYTGDLHLSNERSSGNDIDGSTGNWTIQEGESELYIINNKNGKKYKFKLEEVQ